MYLYNSVLFSVGPNQNSCRLKDQSLHFDLPPIKGDWLVKSLSLESINGSYILILLFVWNYVGGERDLGLNLLSPGWRIPYSFNIKSRGSFPPTYNWLPHYHHTQRVVGSLGYVEPTRSIPVLFCCQNGPKVVYTIVVVYGNTL